MKMKRSWNDLPQELLHIIFESPAITKQTLLELNHVSKNWSQAAKEVLYFVIDLNGQNIHQFLYTMKVPDSHCGNYVKVVRFEEGVDLIEDYLTDVIRVCTNLTELWVGSVVHDDYYQQLQYLHEEKGKLQHYQDGSPPDDSQHNSLFRDYSNAMLAMKKSVGTLYLVDTRLEASSNEYTTEGFDYLAHRLDQFPRLERLVIKTYAPKYLYENDCLIQKCSRNLVATSIVAYNAQMLTRPVSRPSLDMNSVQKRPFVKCLLVNADVLTTTDMEYLMHTYPNVKDFICHSRQLETSFRWRDFSENGVYSPETCARFVNFAAQVRDLELYNLSFPINALEPVLLSIAKRPEVKTLQISAGLFDGVEHASLNLISAQNSHLYRLNEKNAKSWDTQLVLTTQDIKEPYKNLLNIFRGDTIEHLTLNTCPFDESQSVTALIQMQRLGNSLGQVLDSFPNLKEIYLSSVVIRGFSKEGISRHHLKTLSMQKTILHDWIPTRLSPHISKIDHFILREMMILGDSPQHDDARRTILRFPETAFDTVEYRDPFALGAGCLVCITFGYDDEKVHSLNYLINEDSMQRITRDQRDVLFINTDMHQVDFSCASIKKFGVCSHTMGADPLFIYFDQ